MRTYADVCGRMLTYADVRYVGTVAGASDTAEADDSAQAAVPVLFRIGREAQIDRGAPLAWISQVLSLLALLVQKY